MLAGFPKLVIDKMALNSSSSQNVQKTVMSANSPYSKEQGYATSSCWCSMSKAVTNRLDADRDDQTTARRAAGVVVEMVKEGQFHIV